MAICQECEQEMLTASSCTVSDLHVEGVAMRAVPYGREGDAREVPPVRCGDCGVASNGFHHLGCDLARCPRCRQQLLSCGCPFDEFGEQIEDDYDLEVGRELDDDDGDGVDDVDENPCPSCGSEEVIPIIYGTLSPLLTSLSEHGLVEVAGRAFDGAQPSSRCRDCRHAWSRPASKAAEGMPAEGMPTVGRVLHLGET
jgi:hypothetical protein